MNIYYKIPNSNFDCHIYSAPNLERLKLPINTLIVSLISPEKIIGWAPCIKENGVYLINYDYFFIAKSRTIPIEFRSILEKYLKLYVFS